MTEPKSEAIPEIDMSQFRDMFVDESRERMLVLNECTLTLEHTPDDAEALQTILRAAHTLKGMSATMGYDNLARLAHATEDVLDKVQDSDLAMTSELVELLFEAIDALQMLIDDVAVGGTGELDVASTLESLQGFEPEAGTTAHPPVAGPGAPAAIEKLLQPAAATVRVDVHHLDTLLDVVTEMVIHRSLLARLEQRYDLPPLSDTLRVHDRLLAQLHGTVLKMRMLPIGHVFGRFPRMVRDLLKAQGKEARFVVEGEAVKLDRTALEALSDPLVHLLRNAIDHGLEAPAEREAAGKPPSGTLHLLARQEQDSVIIEVGDDGRGMDAQRISAAAVERGIVTAEAAADMSEAHTLELICHPGFSLTEEVTMVSGRGVGMNVVKRQVEALRGSLHIETQPGQGTTFRLQLPAMLTLMRALLVSAGGELYALPTTHVEHIIELEPTKIERVGDQELLHLEDEDKVLPLRRLGELLNAPDCTPDPRHALVVRSNGQIFGLRVDDLLGHEEIVVKPLPAALRGTPGLAGVTILGEGQVVWILDVMGL
jgi:two-component system chemotaxis sensor kinase CheA